MTQDKLEHPLERLFSDFAPPDPEAEQAPAPEEPSEPGDQVADAESLDERPEQAPEASAEDAVWRRGWRSLASDGSNGAEAGE